MSIWVWLLVLVLVVVIGSLLWYLHSGGTIRSIIGKIGGDCCGGDCCGGVEDWEGAHEETYGALDDDAPAPKRQARKVQKYGDAVKFPVSDEKSLELIESGKKTIEVRPGRPSYRALKRGSKVVYVTRDNDKGVEKMVVAVREYPSFEALLKAEPLDKVLPGEKSVATALERIRGYYSGLAAKGVDIDKLQKDLGVLAIEVK